MDKKMILKIITKDQQHFRTVTRTNIIKVAKSIHSLYPDTDYAALHAILKNAIAKQMNSLTIRAKDL
jgi:hypothetical protein